MEPTKRLRSTVVCIQDDNFLAIELQDPTTKKRMWSLPGGQIEVNESPREAAIRETLEETGYSVELLPVPNAVSHYIFRWNAQIYECTTHWFAARLERTDKLVVDDASYLLGHCWLPIQRIDELFLLPPPCQGLHKEISRRHISLEVTIGRAF